MTNLIGLKIKKFTLADYNEITIELNNGSIYSANLSTFNDVYCYPQNLHEGKNATIGECRADIEWSSGFAVHLDQVAALAVEQQTAS